MKNSIFLTLVFLLLISCSGGHQYYVDSENGDDSNSGRSPEKAWASLEKVNSMEFKAGDQLLFKSGTAYFGQLEPKGSGTAEAPIQIDRYGEGTKPAIHGEGGKLHTLLLYNVEYWEVRNLEITNTGAEREANRRGVSIVAENFGDCHHIVLDSLEVHHVNGSLVKGDGGGSAIIWQNNGDSIKTRFVDLIIENCYLHHCGRNGINSWGYTRRDNWHPSVGVIVRNNLLEQIPGDGIVPIGCDGALIENNVMRDCPDILSHKEAAAGIWPWSSDNTVIQFNEVSDHRAKWDGQGFDSDFNCQGTVIQYNYSHDNYGGFLLICNNGNTYGSKGNIGTDGTIIRFNLSVNDGIRPYPTEREGWFSPIMHITGPVTNTKVHSNLIVMPERNTTETEPVVIQMDNWGEKWPVNTAIFNNYFWAYTEPIFNWGEDLQTSFEDNVTNSLETSNAKAIFSLLNELADEAAQDGLEGFQKLRRFVEGRLTNYK